MKDTSGRFGFATYDSDDLSSSLASKLKVQLGTAGSMEYSQTWKRKTTPAGRLYWAHTASARRTSDNGYGGWPTPKTPTGGPTTKSTDKHAGGLDLEGVVVLSGWSTTSARDWKNGRSNQHGKNARPLNEVAQISGTTTKLSLVQTEKRGALNPAFIRWLMGYPEGWESYADMETRSYRK